MREFVLALAYWLHLTATSVWIGGIVFILLVAIPSSKEVLGADAGKLMGEISKKFTPLANYSIMLLVLSGLIMTGFSKEFSGIRTLNNWNSILILKHVPVLGMIMIHFYRGLILSPKIMKTTSAAEKANLQKLSLTMVKINLSAGILVLLLSGFMGSMGKQ